MPEYYALVYKNHSKDPVEAKYCGHLFSTHHKKAYDEASDYEKVLNGGWPKAVLGGEYLTVVPSPTSTARNLKGFSKFKTRRVTDKTKWNTAKASGAKKR